MPEPSSLRSSSRKTYIDISVHIFYTIVDETRTTTRAKLIFPSLLLKLFRLKGVEILQDISLLSTPSTINKLTITRIWARLPGDEEKGDQEEGEPMDTEIEAVGEPLTSRGHGKRSRASSSSAIPSHAFQIILERINELRDVQNEQSNKLAAFQDQMNILSGKFDSFSIQQWPFGHSGQKMGDFWGTSWGGVPVWGGAGIKLTFSSFYLSFCLCLCCWCWYYALDNVVYIMGLLHFG